MKALKKIALLFCLLGFAATGQSAARQSADGPVTDTLSPEKAKSVSENRLSALSSCVFCEIITDHLPTAKANPVLFDFGQATGAWKYNYLTDEAGNKLYFNSGIEALNYMVRRGWEFVQAYSSGEDNAVIHFLLRISVEKLTDKERTALFSDHSPKSEAGR